MNIKPSNMEDNNYGLLQGVECRYVKTDPEIIESIAKKREIEPVRVKSMMRYNIFTIKQFSDLTGLAISSIVNKTRPISRNGEWSTDLDFCYPFQDKKDTGPKFIIRNTKSEKYLQ